MLLRELLDTKQSGKEWFIGYTLDDGERPAEDISTVLHAYSEDDALQEFHDNFWRIAYGDPTNTGPSNVDPSRLYTVIEIRPATVQDRR